MGYKINKILLDNFKCIKDSRILEFNSENLIMLTGPNGYGKTTIFDALEIIFDGDVTRIKDVSSGANRTKMGNLFINDMNRDAFVGVELFNENGKLISLVTRIDKEVKNERLRKISFKHYFVENNIQIAIDEIGRGKINNIEEVQYKNILMKEIGLNIDSYTNAYYLSQEDTFIYLNQSEREKSKIFTNLMRIENEKNFHEKLGGFRSKTQKQMFHKRGQEIEKQIKDKYEEINKNLVPSPYKKLFNNTEIEWDAENAEITNEIAINRVKKIDKFIEYYNDYKKYLNNKKPEGYLENKKLIESIVNIGSYLVDEDELLKKVKIEVETYNNHQIIQDFKNKNENTHISKFIKEINLEKINEILHIDISIDELKQKADEYNTLEKEANKDTVVLNKIKRIGDTLMLEVNKDDYDSSICPLCGWTYQDKSILIKSIDVHKELLESIINAKSKKLNDKGKEINEIIKPIVNKVEDYINGIKDSVISSEQKIQFDAAIIIVEQIKEFVQWAKQNQIYDTVRTDLEEAKGDINKKIALKNIIKEKIHPLEHSDFDKEYEDNEFERINMEYFKNSDDDSDLIRLLSDKSIVEGKLKYLQYVYEKYKKEKGIPELNKLIEQAAKYRFLHKKSDEIYKIYSEKLREFTKKVVENIEIPLCIYTAKILLNYQRGLGVFIDTGDDEECKEVRFVPDKKQTDHDIVNTFSSGQLTAFVISFLLVLNKVNQGKDNKFMPILIDDPVQTMDDINYISLINILRNNFKENQLIMSTHEEEKANFICYKYKKSGLKYKEVNVQKHFSGIN